MNSRYIADFPELMVEWDSDSNAHLDPKKVTIKSSVQAWWTCRANKKHRWEARVRNRAIEGNGCPYCSRRRTLRESSFGVQFPDLLRELHPSKNGDLDPFEVAPSSNRRVWWQCSAGHEWITSFGHRTRSKTGCKRCALNAISIARKAPDLLKEWDWERNRSFDSSEIPATSDQRVWWRCRNDHNHVWQMAVGYRVTTGVGCPRCGNDAPALSQVLPNLRQEWDYTRNSKSFESVHVNSSVKYWWICGRNLTHSWQASPYQRVRSKKGCPLCERRSEQRELRSLEAKFPMIAREWHPSLNEERRAGDFSYGSSYSAWWQCRKHPTHVWQQPITNRTQKNSRCPFCFGRKVSLEKSLQALFPELASEWHATKNKSLTPQAVTPGSARRIWWTCKKNPDHHWEAQIKNRTLLNRGCPRCHEENNPIVIARDLAESSLANSNHYRSFLLSLRLLRKLVSLVPDQERLHGPYLRILYAHAVSILECYLCDAFLHAVISNEGAKRKLLTEITDFNEKRYSLAEYLDFSREGSTRIIAEGLSEIAWHNLSKVDRLYRIVLGISLPQCPELVMGVFSGMLAGWKQSPDKFRAHRLV